MKTITHKESLARFKANSKRSKFLNHCENNPKDLDAQEKKKKNKLFSREEKRKYKLENWKSVSIHERSAYRY